jgi:hypothetical protein
VGPCFALVFQARVATVQKNVARGELRVAPNGRFADFYSFPVFPEFDMGMAQTESRVVVVGVKPMDVFERLDGGFVILSVKMDGADPECTSKFCGSSLRAFL